MYLEYSSGRAANALEYPWIPERQYAVQDLEVYMDLKPATFDQAEALWGALARLPDLESLQVEIIGDYGDAFTHFNSIDAISRLR